MKNLKINLILLFIVLSGIVKSQQSEAELKICPAQVCFVTPLGTNGVDSWNCDNGLSFNIFAGYSGALHGVELGGFANVLRKDMMGVQVAGYCNVVLNKSKGVQLAGFSNYCRKTLTGTQVAGFSNVITDSAMAVQISGFANAIVGKQTGIQIAGFSNATTGKMLGTQLAGFSNYAKSISGGAQIAGFANVSGNMKGTQIAGFANLCRKLSGIQIGVFNYCDSVEKGLPIGVLSIIKHGGYKVFEFGADETFYIQGGVKFGVSKFYNILYLGAKQENDQIIWGCGYGVGTMWKLSERVGGSLDAICYHVNQNEWFTDKLNVLNKIRFTVNLAFTEKISIYCGPTYSVFVTERKSRGEAFDIKGIIPWYTYTKEREKRLVKMYPGFTVGIRL